MVTKFMLPSIGDLKFSKLNYDNSCAYLDNKNTHSTETRKHVLHLMTFCKNIEPFVVYYKRLIKLYNHMVYNIVENETNLILPQVPRKQKCGNITMLVSSFIGLAYGVYPVSYITNEIKLYIWLSKLWTIKPLFSTTT